MICLCVANVNSLLDCTHYSTIYSWKALKRLCAVSIQNKTLSTPSLCCEAAAACSDQEGRCTAYVRWKEKSILISESSKTSTRKFLWVSYVSQILHLFHGPFTAWLLKYFISRSADQGPRGKEVISPVDKGLCRVLDKEYNGDLHDLAAGHMINQLMLVLLCKITSVSCS